MSNKSSPSRKKQHPAQKTASPTNVPDIEEVADMADRGEDVSAFFTGEYVTKQRVNVDFPLELLRDIDSECQRVGITRQAWIKLACDERLRQITGSLFQRRAS